MLAPQFASKQFWLLCQFEGLDQQTIYCTTNRLSGKAFIVFFL